MKILFLHGWISVPGGVKPTYLTQHGHEVLNPKLPDDDFAAALTIAQAEFDQHLPDVIVGSSRGGALAMNLDCGDTPLVLLCPAWKEYGSAKTVGASPRSCTAVPTMWCPMPIPRNWSETVVCRPGRWTKLALITGWPVLNRWR